MNALAFSLPPDVRDALTMFVDEAKAIMGEALVSIILYGSAAEGRLRTTSDINLLLIYRGQKVIDLARLRDAMRAAHAAILLKAMLLDEEELSAAAEAFAVKFGDMQSRHVVLHGTDPLASLAVTRDAHIRRLQQVILNSLIRWRQSYVMAAGRPEQATRLLAEAAGPLRAAAVTYERLQGRSHANPKAALASWVGTMPDHAGWQSALTALSAAREGDAPMPQAEEHFAAVIDLTQVLHRLALKLT
jgi:predicted nucleotidyltransferase